MKRVIGIFLVLIILVVGFAVVTKRIDIAALSLQGDVDKARLEHLIYWSGQIDTYYKATGRYPFQALAAKGKPVLVRIVSKDQARYLIKGGNRYRADLDNNATGRFIEVGMQEFIGELERTFDRPVDERYDIQRAPVRTPIGYNYFVTDEGYLLWAVCQTCGITNISTLLPDGVTPSVNIVSAGMKSHIAKSLTRDEMLKDPTFQQWQAKPYEKERFVRAREGETLHDSKQVEGLQRYLEETK